MIERRASRGSDQYSRAHFSLGSLAPAVFRAPRSLRCRGNVTILRALPILGQRIVCFAPPGGNTWLQTIPKVHVGRDANNLVHYRVLLWNGTEVLSDGIL